MKSVRVKASTTAPVNEQFEELFAVFSSISKQFFEDLAEQPVAHLTSSLNACSLAHDGVDIQRAIEVLREQVIPQLSASRGPRYWGFVTGGATPIATFADWLVSSFDQNLSKDGDSIATAIERQTLSWLCELFDLPATFQGTITTGATASNFLGALCARQFIGNQQQIDIAKQGVFGLQVEVFATTPHASMLKSLGMAGLGRDRVTAVNALDNSEAMDVEHLATLLAQSQSAGKIIIASTATVTATDFDDLTSIAALAKQHSAWLHVDAAFGIFERLVAGEESKSLGLEMADSITLDNHKWLNVPYESGAFLTRHQDLLFDSCDVPAPYLASDNPLPDFMSLGIENSRRFRALPVWMTLLTYGKRGITQQIKSNIALAKLFASKINESHHYQLMLPCQLNVVLFRPNCEGLTLDEANAKTQLFLQKINTDGRVFLSPGKWQGQNIIRAALSNWETTEADIKIAMACLLEVTAIYTSDNNH